MSQAANDIQNLSATQSISSEVMKSHRPPDTAFKQQRLPAWQPIMSPRWVIGCFFVLSSFIPIGIVILLACDSVVEIEKRYDQDKVCPPSAWKNYETGRPYCEIEVSITPDQEMKAPIYMYYKLENFYQNHRRYAKSRSDTQLSGGAETGTWADCEPFLHPGEYRKISDEDAKIQLKSKGEVDLRTVVYNPCGLIAWSMFNDSFQLYRKLPNGLDAELICDGENFDAIGGLIDTSKPGRCEKKGIAWPSDPGIRFKKAPSNVPTTLTSEGWQDEVLSTTQLANDTKQGFYIGETWHKIPDTADLDLMVWMRLAPLSSFRKLYRIINTDLKKETYYITVHSRFDVSQFEGRKFIVLTTSSFIGGKSYFLASLYIAVGGICLIFGAGFLAKHLTTPQRLTAL